MKVNSGNDQQAQALSDPAGDSGTATSTTASSLTNTGATWTVNAWTGKIVTAGTTYGFVLSNTSTALTIDKWYNPTSPGGSAASTPSGTSTYVICPGNAPAFWMALTQTNTTPVATDTSLAGELSGNGFSRAVATWAHGAGASTYTLSKVFTSSSGSAITPAMAAILAGSANGRMLFESQIPSPPAMLSGDTLTPTSTVSM